MTSSTPPAVGVADIAEKKNGAARTTSIAWANVPETPSAEFRRQRQSSLASSVGSGSVGSVGSFGSSSGLPNASGRSGVTRQRSLSSPPPPPFVYPPPPSLLIFFISPPPPAHFPSLGAPLTPPIIPNNRGAMAASDVGLTHANLSGDNSSFLKRVSFDTFNNKDASDFSLTLKSKHKDYAYTRRSRTFLCGTDQNDYSEFALEWLIDELVDDGDEIVCLRVVDKDSKMSSDSAALQERLYRQEARKLLNQIIEKNEDDKTISVILEFAVGKVHETIQKMVQLTSRLPVALYFLNTEIIYRFTSTNLSF